MSHQLLQPVKGTKDLLPEEYARFQYIIETAQKIATCYGYRAMSTPIFEFTHVFNRTLGDASDIVTKEMYSFEDRGGESITLRPEFTAGIARAFISNGLHLQVPLKYFSAGPVFRYERPQKGRMRQFHQINMECLGGESPNADVEVIALGSHILEALEIRKLTTLQLNSLGDTESRLAYREALVKYLTSYHGRLSHESQERFHRNPLRILDSKDPGDQEIIRNAPNIQEYFTEKAQNFFAKVQEGLEILGISYTVNPQLVRGLDYYAHTAFEFTTEHLGAQNTVMAGGRYDSLIRMMGGVDTPAVGFAAGIERLALMMQYQPDLPRAIAIIPVSIEEEKQAMVIAHLLRHQGYNVHLDFSGNLAKRMKRAGKMNARAAIIFGKEEIDKSCVKLKDFDSACEKEIPSSTLIDALAAFK